MYVFRSLTFPGDARILPISDDDLDALVSALTAALSYAGKTHPPPPHLEDLAASESWIHVPIGETLPCLESLSFPNSRSTP